MTGELGVQYASFLSHENDLLRYGSTEKFEVISRTEQLTEVRCLASLVPIAPYVCIPYEDEETSASGRLSDNSKKQHCPTLRTKVLWNKHTYDYVST